MGIGVGIVLPIGLWVCAIVIGRRELALYREQTIGDDLFLYSKWRLLRRLTGVAIMVALGATLMAYQLLPPKTSFGTSVYLGALVAEVIALVLLPIFDLAETMRTADPEDLTRQADPDRRTRKQPRRPR